MLLGEFEHSLDDKFRITLPRRFRDDFEGGGVMAKAMDGCLALYPTSEWARVAEQARELSRLGKRERETARTFFSGAQDFTLDRQGRFAVPAKLRAYAALDKDVVVAGVFSRVELWDAQRWNDRASRVDEDLVAAQDLPDFGI
jgi:MraZ protein